MTVQNRYICFYRTTFWKTYENRKIHYLQAAEVFFRRQYGVSYLLYNFELFKTCSCSIYITASSSNSQLGLVFPLRTLTMSRDLCEGAIGILCIEAKDLAAYPTSPRTSPYNKELFGPRCQSILLLLGEKYIYQVNLIKLRNLGVTDVYYKQKNM